MPARTCSCSTICRPGSAGRCRPRRKFVEGDVGDQNLVRRLLAAQQCRRHHPFRRIDRGARIGRRSARLLSQQHLQVALADRGRGRGQDPAFHLLIDRRGLRHRRRSVPVTEDIELTPISPYGTSKLMTEIMLRDTAAAHAALRGACAISTSPAPTRRAGPASRRRTRPISSRSPRKRRSASGPISKCSAPTTRHRTAPASATISMSAIWSAPISTRCAISAQGGKSEVLNCGYGDGFSVLEVIAAVKRAAKTRLPGAHG